MAVKLMSRVYNVGIYVRLSKEDALNSQKKQQKGNPFASESASIENQKRILTDYVQLRGWSIANIYQDDGYGGGDFQRPDFQRMLSDAKSGIIDLILCKDLSRFGRAYVDVGYYTQEVFPSLGVRFIALMDNLDSEGNDDLLPFRSIMNDYHLKDLSRKIKSVLRAKAEKGSYIGAYAPYGYVKSGNPAQLLSIDPYAASVVKRMFELRAAGHGYAKIAALLNKDRILPPQAYCYELDGRKNPYKSATVWQATTVKTVLRNETYIGNLVKFKQGTLSYKSKKRVDRPPERWVRAENTHKPIVPRELWDTVQEINAKVRKPTKEYESYLFGGLLKCADCGKGFTGNRANRKRTNGESVAYVQYSCSLFVRTGHSECTSHSISEKTLLELMRSDINKHLRSTKIDCADIVQKQSESVIVKAEKSVAELSEVIAKCDTFSARLYEDRLNGLINLETYKKLSDENESERESAQSEHEKMERFLNGMKQSEIDKEKWLESMKRYISLEVVDREMLCELVERIEIGERKVVNGEKQQNIRIVYRFGVNG
jgi:DNA invertase Pin-like site-specific DNA recombinase